MSNVELASELYAKFARGEVPGVLASFTPDIEWREAEGNPYQMDGAAWVGPQAVAEKLFVAIASEWDGFTIAIGTLHDAGDYVVMEGRMTGTYRPSGKAVDAQVCHVLRFRDGKLASFQQYGDTAQLQDAMTSIAMTTQMRVPAAIVNAS